MDIKRTKQLAGLPSNDNEPFYRELTEVVQLSDDLSIEDLTRRLDACKRALSLVSKLPDPADRKKWLSATFVNMNKVRAALKRLIAKEDAQLPKSQLSLPLSADSTSSQGPSPSP